MRDGFDIWMKAPILDFISMFLPNSLVKTGLNNELLEILSSRLGASGLALLRLALGDKNRAIMVYLGRLLCHNPNCRWMALHLARIGEGDSVMSTEALPSQWCRNAVSFNRLNQGVKDGDVEANGGKPCSRHSEAGSHCGVFACILGTSAFPSPRKCSDQLLVSEQEVTMGFRKEGAEGFSSTPSNEGPLSYRPRTSFRFLNSPTPPTCEFKLPFPLLLLGQQQHCPFRGNYQSTKTDIGISTSSATVPTRTLVWPRVLLPSRSQNVPTKLQSSSPSLAYHILGSMPPRTPSRTSGAAWLNRAGSTSIVTLRLKVQISDHHVDLDSC